MIKIYIKNKMISLNKITSKGKALYLAYDQGLEHGPEMDFNDNNIDPLYILDIAKKGKYNGIVFQYGIAERCYKYYGFWSYWSCSWKKCMAVKRSFRNN